MANQNNESEKLYECDHCGNLFPKTEMQFDCGIWGEDQYCDACYDDGNPCESCGAMIEYGDECNEDCQCDECRSARAESRWDAMIDTLYD